VSTTVLLRGPWSFESLKSLENCFVEEAISGGQNCPWRSDCHLGLVRPLAHVPGWSDRQSWPVRPSAFVSGRSNRQHLRSNFFWIFSRYLLGGLTASSAESSQWLVFGVWAINTPPSHARYDSWPFQQHTWSLRALSFLTQAFHDPLWVYEVLVLDLSALKLCGTSDSSIKCHRLVTLGGCRLLNGLEEWKPWAIQEDCEGGPMFLWDVLCSPHQSGEEQL
jgi:hypothetical protein